MFQKFFSKDYQRRHALKRTRPGALQNFLSAEFPHRKSTCRDVPIVALDMETTGLDPKKDAILSIGLVEIRGLRIQLSSAWEQVIKVRRDLPAESVVIHRITDDAKEQGRPLEEVLPELLERLKGKIMLVHFRHIEQNFLDAACRRLYGAPFVIPIIDTLELGQRVFERQNHSIQAADLRLFNLRPRYNLPRYEAHNALNDALATAELFLAMIADMAPNPPCQVGQFITH